MKTEKSDLSNFVLQGYAASFDYSKAPILIYWESTRACELACTHCRAEAMPFRDPSELSTTEVKRFFDQILSFQSSVTPRIVITGGDPLMRADIFELIAYGISVGLDISVTPAGTKRLTVEKLRKMKELGVSGLGLSLDGSDSLRHDAIRQVSGSFDMTAAACHSAVRLGYQVQINTMVTAETIDDIPQVYELIKSWKIDRWSLFLLITTGRGEALSEITAEQSERFFNYLYKLMPDSPFPIKTTEAHHFRRIVYNKMKNRGLSDQQIVQTPVGRGFGIRDANGIIFVSHTGDVYPSGFLPIKVDSVRSRPINEIYCENEMLKSIRDPMQLKGKCSGCEFKLICGGSRSRAYSVSGDALQSDPLCVYESSNNISMQL